MASEQGPDDSPEKADRRPLSAEQAAPLGTAAPGQGHGQAGCETGPPRSPQAPVWPKRSRSLSTGSLPTAARQPSPPAAPARAAARTVAVATPRSPPSAFRRLPAPVRQPQPAPGLLQLVLALTALSTPNRLETDMVQGALEQAHTVVVQVPGSPRKQSLHSVLQIVLSVARGLESCCQGSSSGQEGVQLVEAALPALATLQLCEGELSQRMAVASRQMELLKQYHSCQAQDLDTGSSLRLAASQRKRLLSDMLRSEEQGVEAGPSLVEAFEALRGNVAASMECLASRSNLQAHKAAAHAALLAAGIPCATSQALSRGNPDLAVDCGAMHWYTLLQTAQNVRELLRARLAALQALPHAQTPQGQAVMRGAWSCQTSVLALMRLPSVLTAAEAVHHFRAALLQPLVGTRPVGDALWPSGPAQLAPEASQSGQHRSAAPRSARSDTEQAPKRRAAAEPAREGRTQGSMAPPQGPVATAPARPPASLLAALQPARAAEQAAAGSSAVQQPEGVGSAGLSRHPGSEGKRFMPWQPPSSTPPAVPKKTQDLPDQRAVEPAAGRKSPSRSRATQAEARPPRWSTPAALAQSTGVPWANWASHALEPGYAGQESAAPAAGSSARQGGQKGPPAGPPPGSMLPAEVFRAVLGQGQQAADAQAMLQSLMERHPGLRNAPGFHRSPDAELRSGGAEAGGPLPGSGP